MAPEKPHAPPYPTAIDYRIDALEARIERIEREGLARTVAEIAGDVRVIRAEQAAATRELAAWQQVQDRRMSVIEQRLDHKKAQIALLMEGRAEAAGSVKARKALVAAMWTAVGVGVAILSVLVNYLGSF